MIDPFAQFPKIVRLGLAPPEEISVRGVPWHRTIRMGLVSYQPSDFHHAVTAIAVGKNEPHAVYIVTAEPKSRIANNVFQITRSTRPRGLLEIVNTRKLECRIEEPMRYVLPSKNHDRPMVHAFLDDLHNLEPSDVLRIVTEPWALVSPAETREINPRLGCERELTTADHLCKRELPTDHLVAQAAKLCWEFRNPAPDLSAQPSGNSRELLLPGH